MALLGSETAQDAVPAPDGAEVGALPLHDFALIMLGIHLLDNMNLDAVAEAASARKRWEFLLTAAPLPVRGGDRLAAQPDCRVLTLSRGEARMRKAPRGRRRASSGFFPSSRGGGRL